MDDLVIRLAEVSSLEGAPRITYRRFRHQGPRISDNAEVALTGCELVLRKHSQFFGAHRQLHARHLATLSVDYLRAGRWWPAVRAMSSSVLADPKRRRALRQWMGTLTGLRVYGSYLRIRQHRGEPGRLAPVTTQDDPPGLPDVGEQHAAVLDPVAGDDMPRQLQLLARRELR